MFIVGIYILIHIYIYIYIIAPQQQCTLSAYGLISINRTVSTSFQDSDTALHLDTPRLRHSESTTQRRFTTKADAEPRYLHCEDSAWQMNNIFNYKSDSNR